MQIKELAWAIGIALCPSHKISTFQINFTFHHRPSPESGPGVQGGEKNAWRFFKTTIGDERCNWRPTAATFQHTVRLGKGRCRVTCKERKEEEVFFHLESIWLSFKYQSIFFVFEKGRKRSKYYPFFFFGVTFEELRLLLNRWVLANFVYIEYELPDEAKAVLFDISPRLFKDAELLLEKLRGVQPIKERGNNKVSFSASVFFSLTRRSNRRITCPGSSGVGLSNCLANIVSGKKTPPKMIGYCLLVPKTVNLNHTELYSLYFGYDLLGRLLASSYCEQVISGFPGDGEDTIAPATREKLCRLALVNIGPMIKDADTYARQKIA